MLYDYDDDADNCDRVFLSWVEFVTTATRYVVWSVVLLGAFLAGCLAQEMVEVW